MMNPHLTLSQITLLAGIALGAALALVLLFYFLHKMIGEHRKGMDFRPKPPRTEKEAAFLAATVQGVIADLKTGQRNLEGRLRAAEERARASARTLEAVAREIEEALVVVDRKGYVVMANRAARELLGIDVWSRRRYREILGADSPLAESILEGFATGKERKKETALPARGENQSILHELTITPIEAPGGAVEGIICLLRKIEAGRASPSPPASADFSRKN